MKKHELGKIALGVALMGSMVASAYAGGDAAGGSEFTEIWDLLEGWTQGVLGRIIALGALIVGIAFGLVRQSVVAAVIGISMAIVLQYGPGVIESIISATAPGVDATQLMTLENGMEAVKDIVGIAK